MGETLDSSKKYEAGQDIRITRKEEGQEWSFDNWGDCRFQAEEGTAEEGNFYTDARITQKLFTEPILEAIEDSDRTQPATIVDFGGGAGIMLSQVNQQLHEAGIEQTEPILVDGDEKKIEHAKTAHPELQSIVGDVFHLPFDDNSIDAGVSRNLMQYFPPPEEKSEKTNQFDILREMHRVMKPGSTLVLVWPGAYKYHTHNEQSRAAMHDMFWSQVTWDRTGEDNEDPNLSRRGTMNHLAAVEDSIGNKQYRVRACTPGEIMADFAQKVGFSIKQGEEADWLEFRYTYDAILNRFSDIPDQNKGWLQTTFGNHTIGALKRYFKGIDSPDDIIDYQNHPAIRLPISRLILKKENKLEV
ncbi:MAG: class I SAM-dependent methyltransferase [Candidatus Berkelbacteria bacterium]|nr:class I SAM-dependent methyltransferase [Candidatus Berkelbacteria bacterium]